MFDAGGGDLEDVGDVAHHPISSATSRVRAALAELVSSIDQLDHQLDDVEHLAEQSFSTLARVVASVWESRSLLDAVMVAANDPWDVRRGWNRDGSRCATARFVSEMKCSPQAAREVIWRTRSLRTMPQTRAAYLDGQLTTSMVDLLIRTRRDVSDPRAFARDEQILVRWCRDRGYHDARRALAYWVAQQSPRRDEDEHERRRRERRLDVSINDDGTVRVQGCLDPIGGSILTEELKRIEHELYLADRHEGVGRTIVQRRADALVEMATRSGAVPAGARRPRALITIVTGHDDFTHLCELANGTRIAPGQMVPLLTAADIEHIAFDGHKRAITATSRRAFTGALRRAIEVRDRHCQHPCGCDVPSTACDIDHITPRHGGGATTQSNGRALCSTHNRNVSIRSRAPDPHPAVARARRRLRRSASADTDHHR
jgi:5-methylcytosine-specific restriction endonuclease McrA